MKGIKEQSSSMGIRITPTQARQWRMAALRAGHKTLSSWLRSLASQAARTGDTGREPATELAALRTELGRIGNNLNQLTRYSHQQGQMQDVEACLQEVRQAARSAHAALQKLTGTPRAGTSAHDHQ